MADYIMPLPEEGIADLHCRSDKYLAKRFGERVENHKSKSRIFEFVP
ncbi:MAG: hypothetical protein K2J00_02495 [Bacteroidaceae bacterium]|nr:hypothetical protein [Bacteroidaceae bacterium]